MNALDIISLVIIGVFVIIGIWKGFLKLLLRFGALILSGILAKLLGPWLGQKLLPSLLETERLSNEMLSRVNSMIGSVVGTVLVFVVSLLILRLLARIIAKALTKETRVGIFDRLLGAIVGCFAGVAVLSLFAMLVNACMIVVALIYPETGFFDVVENTVIFKYFLGLL